MVKGDAMGKSKKKEPKWVYEFRKLVMEPEKKAKEAKKMTDLEQKWIDYFKERERECTCREDLEELINWHDTDNHSPEFSEKLSNMYIQARKKMEADLKE